MAHYGMVIDTKRCVGCNACSMACKMTNNLPDTNWWTRVLTEGGDEIDTPAGIFPDVSMRYLTVSCQHCDNPACTKVCPVGATYKDPETGVVRQDYDKCIGCRMCMAACPYTGVRSFNWDEPKYSVEHAVGDADIAPHQKHVVEKCTFCYQRLARGEDRPGGGKALGVGAAAAVAHGLHGLHDRVDDAGRLAQGGRRVVQIDHSLASCHFLSQL